ncbi:MAG: thioredoxin family protein [Bacillota bacterium]|jgi:thiol-disulfide isomerase/thioredoxin|nr:thioredoxin family protein [Bacillota bacterium]
MLNSKNYKEVLSKEGKSILLISGPGCANCIAMYPIVNDFINKYSQILLHNIEITEEYKDLVENYSIEQIPAILLFENGELLSKIYGYQPYEIFELYVTDKFKL